MSELTKQQLLDVMHNELHCIERQFDNVCDNKRDCNSCDLRLEASTITSAYKQIIDTLQNRHDLEIFLVGRIYEKLTRVLRVISKDCKYKQPIAFSIRLPQTIEIDTEKVKAIFNEVFLWHTIVDRWSLSSMEVRQFGDVLHMHIILTKVMETRDEE